MTNEEAKMFLDNLKICIDEHPAVADWLVEIADRKTEQNSSEKPNNCEYITEDGVTCAKYPACDDCLDNPLNKVKGSERLVKGSEQTEPTISKMEQVDEPQTDYGDFANRLAYERGVKHAWEVAQKVFDSTVTFYEAEDVAKQIDKDINVRSKDEPQTNPCDGCVCDDGKHLMYCMNCKGIAWKTEPPKVEDEPQTGEMMTEEEFDSMLARVLTGNAEPQTDCPWK